MKKIDFIFRLLLSLSVLVGLLIALAKSKPVTGIAIKNILCLVSLPDAILRILSAYLFLLKHL
jgi:hypothetical protein